MRISRDAMKTFVRNRASEMKFDLDDIRAVFFRCKECRTAVSFPRIRWVGLPERCPNCGSPWMHEPSATLLFSEEAVNRAFQAANAFRDALQSLVTVAHSAGFTVGVEAGEPSENGNGDGAEAEAVASEAQAAAAGGKEAPSS